MFKISLKPTQCPSVRHRHLQRNYTTTHQLLEVGSECKVEDESCIVEGPELLDDSRPHVVVMHGGEEVAQEPAHVIVELSTRTDRVALTLHRRGEGARLKEKKMM